MRKKLIITLATAVVLALASFVAAAQQNDNKPAMTFAEEEFDFGVQKEDGGKLSHAFKFTNDSKKSHTILNAQSYCKCTVASVEKKTYKPGESGEVIVTFEPYGYEGPTEKSIVVTFDDKSIVRLTIKTDLIPRVKPVEEEYPIVIENGIRITSTALKLGQIPLGETKSVILKAYNTNSKPVKLAFKPVSDNGLTVKGPNKLPAKKGTEIEISYTANGKPHFVYETLKPVFSGKIPVISNSTSETIIDVTADFIVAENSGKSWLNSQYINLGTIQKPATGQKTVHKEANFTLTNQGTEDLTVFDVFCPEGLTTDLKAGSVLKPGESIKFSLHLDASGIPAGKNYFENVRIMSSDKEYPVREIIVSAKIK